MRSEKHYRDFMPECFFFIKHLLRYCSAGWTLAKNIRKWHFVNASQKHLQATLARYSTVCVTLSLLSTQLSFSSLIYVLCLAFMFSPCCSRTQFGLPESEACFLQGSGQRRLRGLAVEKERCKGLLFSEMEEVLVCPEGQLPVLVHQWRGKSLFFRLVLPFSSLLSEF